ncbi:MAG: nucleoside 2-deoxyribosyltransferase [Proteobacteria bacterium]|nr:nucleoside 2-deoxyribosyltransferase [Pseudomonadota bacterium]
MAFIFALQSTISISGYILGRVKINILNQINSLTRAIEKANGVVAVLDGVDVDSGTASEIGCACARGKPILGFRSDFRLTGDNESCTVNVQVEYFIEKSGGKVVTNLSELKAELKRMFR